MGFVQLQRQALVLVIVLQLRGWLTGCAAFFPTALRTRNMPMKPVSSPSSTTGSQMVCNPFTRRRRNAVSSLRVESEDKKDGGQDEEDKDEELTPAKIASMIEVSFVEGVKQLAVGYIDILKLFIAAVLTGYGTSTPVAKLIQDVTDCPDQSANRALMPEEESLRTQWIQLIYFVATSLEYRGISLKPDEVNVVETTFESVFPRLMSLHSKSELFQADQILQESSDIIPVDSFDQMEKAIMLQSLRVMWLTLTVIEEEQRCIDDNDSASSKQPRPPIPGAYK